MKNVTMLLLLLLSTTGITIGQSLSQTVMANSGETIVGAVNTLSFTVGEPVIGTISSAPTLGQGFWLGAVEGIVLGAEDFDLPGNLGVFPNPVNDVLNISFRDIQGEAFGIYLYDISGRLILQHDIENNISNEQLYVGSLTRGVYLINILRAGDTQPLTFKIIKE